MPAFTNTYFDNASTSWPKPAEVPLAISEFMTSVGGTYGRAAYQRIYHTSAMVEECREEMAKVLGVAESGDIAFSQNATYALNSIIMGLDLHDCEVLISPLEHNAVMRPLEYLKTKRNVHWKVLPSQADGAIIPERIPEHIGDRTRLVVINHQSNVNGVIQPVQEIRQFIGDLPLLVDTTQSLGSVPFEGDRWEVDFIAFTGHKGLLGPTGTGGFFVRNPELLAPYAYGGTGSRSESLEMPMFSPDKYEAGTHNTVGVSGLLAALKNRSRCGWKGADLQRLLQRLQKIPQVRVISASDEKQQGNVFSIVHENLKPSTIALRLYDRFGIEIRSGLHCAPQAHRFLDTFPSGTARFAPSNYHTPEDLKNLGDVLVEILTD